MYLGIDMHGFSKSHGQLVIQKEVNCMALGRKEKLHCRVITIVFLSQMLCRNQKGI